jgi:hypothetical protein
MTFGPPTYNLGEEIRPVLAKKFIAVHSPEGEGDFPSVPPSVHFAEAEVVQLALKS